MRVAAFDIGSSSIRAALFNARANPIRNSFVSRTYSIRYGADGAAELSPRSLLRALQECARQVRLSKADAITACTFWHGLLGLGRNLEPLTPIYTWGDSRASSAATQLRKQFDEKRILETTGCMLRFPYWPAKLKWLSTNHSLFRRVKYWVSPGDWMFYQLFGELATSESMASGTGLLSRKKREWNREICRAIGIDVEQLPSIGQRLGNGDVFTAIGDGAASNLGSGAIHPQVVAINLGTSAAVRVMVSRTHLRATPFGLFRYAVDSDNDLLGGAISNAGNVHACIERQMKTQSSLSPIHAASDSLTILPFLVRERAPDWPETPAIIAGLRANTTIEAIARAFTTSTVYQVAEVFDRLRAGVRRVVVSGGMSRSRGVLQILADVLGHTLEVPRQSEASLRGAVIHLLRQMQNTAPLPKIAWTIQPDRQRFSRHRRRRREQRELLKKMESLRRRD